MFPTTTYTARRERLRKDVGSSIILILGNNEAPMNYRANTYHFRQDSNFLYFFGLDQPNLASVLDVDAGEDIIFGDELTMEDVVWTGPLPTIAEQAQNIGVAKTLPFNMLGDFVKKAVAQGRPIHFTPPYRHDNMILLSDMLGQPVAKLKENASEVLIRAIVAQRSYKSAEEIAEMERAVDISGAMHVAVMKATAAGKKEAELAGIAAGIATGMGGALAYGIIMSVQGQVLHNHHHYNTLQSGQLLLGDHGAETHLHYAGDLTRTCPVDKKFTDRQRDIYNLVLDAEVSAIESLKPGLPYLDVHLAAARRMSEGLKSLGLMKGDLDEAVAQGAHALFFPHGLGHQIGLDVHDMEDLGEDFVGYSDEIKRSKLFGTAYLRLGRTLEPGFVLTVEPGLYFIPELMDQWEAEGKFTDFINYGALKDWRNFGGIRIEDNILVTEDGHRILGKPVPKTVEEVEALRG
ncbi:MAG: aminopeptidase P family protein [Saprospiraceae bacterium]|nr:aminopeptidase P family protein [Saprospiraceae bacterium]MCF8250077.1 aminopeptidase P family protein [Saprospiraceae bacterium]MCF8279539.1 aminopeptidase P family protein [Bacteroidales bacterium]MCF8311957.1 aminopeptidase P family protein [Saprospiraceae bacterium]MCF8440353.1 aminopeptidase P family protein [Saprospiraceae bacterium]